MPGGLRLEVHLGGEETAGAFCLTTDEPPVGWRLPAHRHRREAETMHVIDGLFEVSVEQVEHRLSAGQTLHVPAGVAHATRNIGDRRGRRLVVYSPAGMERFFLEAGADTQAEQIDGSAALLAATRHGWEFLGRA